ncbi:hypothetical protein B0H15DRAFT_947108 [Mycena belliarum]|uniref:Protein kinase domain-containing protein n=1 Tax=Mycena belliarum TaxID=1033014 RepID=A0AAD6XXA7_9AGAR|nr:hypothetical protein B0H15DRAFT_947108 [Mycena belliae]
MIDDPTNVSSSLPLTPPLSPCPRGPRRSTRTQCGHPPLLSRGDGELAQGSLEGAASGSHGRATGAADSVAMRARACARTTAGCLDVMGTLRLALSLPAEGPDRVLSDKLQSAEEIGYGNWGTSTLYSLFHSGPIDPPLRRQRMALSSKGGPRLTRRQLRQALQETKNAVKLVHRSQTSTTAAHVKSLWNEMKIFLRKRGVVRSDIKPTNILLSSENNSFLVDVAFADKYDIQSGTASLMGHPWPYLSPERARGLSHDTRKSDFATKADLEKHWARTLRGKWDPTKLASPWSSTAKEDVAPSGLDSSSSKAGDTGQRSITNAAKGHHVEGNVVVQVPARKRVPVPPVVDLSPIKGSPQASPPASSAKHNVMSLTAAAAHSRRPLAAIGARRENLPQPPRVASKDTTPKIRPLADLTGANRNNHTKEQKKRDSVKDRGASGSGRSSG